MIGAAKDMPWRDGRGERIRTSGLYVPNVALYQAKLHPEFFASNQNFRSTEKSDNCSRLSRHGESGRSANRAVASAASALAQSRA